VDSVTETAAVLRAHWELGEAGVVVAQPISQEVALNPQEMELALVEAEHEAMRQGVRGKALTPFLLSELADATQGRSLRANQALLVANARLAAQIAAALGNR
jgi:pseudouridine-5'-phosphate glycosidase